MKDIFISYKSEDIEAARKVRDHLESEGLSVWMAPDSITGGASYAAEIPPAIDNARVFVLIFTKNTQSSKWVSRELDRAINGNKIIMPLMMEDFALNNEFSFYLANVQRYPAYENYGKSLVKMTDEIKKYLAPPKPKKPDTPKPPKPKKPKQPRQKKKTALIALGAIIAVALFLIVINAVNKVEIAGETFEKDETSLYFYKKVLTAEDVNKITQMEHPIVLSFDECTINAADIGLMVDESIQVLSFSNCNLTKEQIASLDLSKNKLSALTLSGCELDSVDFIASQAESLYTLCISNTNVSDISVLASFSKLTKFEAENCKITDISALAGCEELQALKLNGNGTESLMPLENLTEITRLDVSHNKLKNLDGIEKCLRLTMIAADNNQLENIDGLQNATKLLAVSLSKNNIKDISLLEKSEQSITDLYLADNLIEDIAALEGYTELRNIDISGNGITDISPLENKAKLASLDASRNKIEGKVSLEGTPELKYLALTDNGITELEAALKDEIGNVLAVGKNKLTKITIGCTQAYKMLILDENDMADFDEIYKSKGKIILDYSEKLDLDKLKAAEYNKMILIGVPLDRQVAVAEKLGAVYVEFYDKAEYDINEIMPDYSHGTEVF